MSKKYFIPKGTKVEVYQFGNSVFNENKFITIITSKDIYFDKTQIKKNSAKISKVVFKAEDNWIMRVDNVNVTLC